MILNKRSILTALTLAVALALTMGSAASGENLAAMSNLGDQMAWQASGNMERFSLTVTGPGTQFAARADGGSAAAFSLYDEAGEARPDGIYSWEIREEFAPVNDRVRDEANGRDTAAHDGEYRTELSGRVQQGTFTIHNGAIVDSSLVEVQASRPAKD